MVKKLKVFLTNTVSWFIWHLARERQDFSNQLPVLCYHRILPGFLEGEDPVYTVLPEQFESHLALLADQGFQALSLEEFAEAACGHRSLPRRAVLLTFDDGYADNYFIAWPLAQKYRMPLNLFICTGNIGQPGPLIMTEDGYQIGSKASALSEQRPNLRSHIARFPHLWRPLTWQELGEMRAAGVGIGLHGHTHRHPAHLRGDALIAEIATGLSIFKRLLGFRSRFFALPYGWYDADPTEILTILQRHQVDFVFGSSARRARLPGQQPLWPRFGIEQHDTLGTLTRKLYGAYDWVASVGLIKRRLLHRPF